MYCHSRLRQAVADYTQAFDGPGSGSSKQSIEYLEGALSEKGNCDDCYLAVCARATTSWDQLSVLAKCFSFFRKYLLRYPPQRETLRRLLDCCNEAAEYVPADKPDVKQCIAYVKQLVAVALNPAGSAAVMGNKLTKNDDDKSKRRDRQGTGHASGPLSRAKSRPSAAPASATAEPVAPTFADSAFVSVGGGPPEVSARRASLPEVLSGGAQMHSTDGQQRKGTADLDSPWASTTELGRAGSAMAQRGGIPEDLFEARWQSVGRSSAVQDDQPTLLEWSPKLPHCSTHLFSSRREAEYAHTAAPAVQLEGDFKCAFDSGAGVEIQQQAIEHLRTVTQMQMDELKSRRDATAAPVGADAGEPGQFSPGHRPLFLYRPYREQERLEMSVVETAAVVAIVLGPGAAEGLLGNNYAEFLEVDVLGSDPWDGPPGQRSQGQAMASIFVKLIMDMWSDMPPQQSLALVLELFRGALRQDNVACRARAFDALYNLSLHAHMLEQPCDAATSSARPSRAGNADDATSARDAAGASTNGAAERPSLFNLTSAQGEDMVAELPASATLFLQWLRCLLFDMLLDCAQRGESFEPVWSAAAGALLALTTHEGAVSAEWLLGLSTTAMAALLKNAQRFSWSFEIQGTLVSIACALMYMPSLADGSSDRAPPVADWGAVTCDVAAAPVNLQAVDDFGGPQHLVRWLRCSPTDGSRRSLLAVLLDVASARAASSSDSYAAYVSSKQMHRLRLMLASDECAGALVLAVQEGRRGSVSGIFSDGVERHLRDAASAAASRGSVAAACQALQTLLAALDEVVQGVDGHAATGPVSAWPVRSAELRRDCLSSASEASARGWSAFHAMLTAPNEATRELAAQLLADLLWHGRLQDVEAAAKRLYAPKASRLPDAAAVAQTSFLPGPSSFAQLPDSHVLQRCCKILEAVFTDKACRAHCALVLMHALHRLTATFLRQKALVHAFNPGGPRTSSQHVHVFAATVQGAVEWLNLLPRRERHMPMLCISRLLFETLTVAQQPGPAEEGPYTGQLRPTGPEAAAPSAALSSLTHFLQGRITVPSLVVLALPPPLLVLLRDNVLPPHADAQPPAAAGFHGWATITGAAEPAELPRLSHSHPAEDPRAGQPPVDYGFAFGLASARDARLALYVLLLARCRLDTAALRSIGGTASLLQATQDDDARVRFVVADFILARAQQHAPTEFRSALNGLITRAQTSNNGKHVENPVFQLHEFMSNRMLAIDDL